MEAITQIFDSLLSQFEGANFALLVLIDACAFGAVFLLTLIGCIFSQKIRRQDKRPYLSAVNAFTAVTLAIFLIRFTLAQSIAATAVFWCVGYLTYGFLRLFRPKTVRAVQQVPAETVSVIPAARPSRPAAQQPQTPANGTVRLEHALSIADKLLLKNLGRGDRQELEKIKTALTVLKVKGVLSANEGEALNDMFNALLKLMAKYDL
ncbi:MAG: hypothetical protein K2O67_06870 [Clostridia bacterium]|nr:hypothetical protein [Clostridia bacterium]